MTKYKTEVEAFQMTKTHLDKSKWPAWLKKVWTDGAPAVGAIWLEDGTGEFYVGTEEGALVVALDDWIIQDAQGVLSVRAPDGFLKSYTAVKK